MADIPNKTAEIEATEVSPSWPWQHLLPAVWLAGSGLWLVISGRRVNCFRALLRHGCQAPPDLQERARGLAAALRVRCPEVWLVPGVLSPMLWVLGRSRRLLLPAHLLERLTEEQRDTLLAHELAHLRRGDPWVRYLELAVTALYWWCPLVWWARRELREAEEECCDAWVVWILPGLSRAYALALVETVDFMAESRPALPVLASGFGHVQLLRRRLTMIMRGTTPRSLTFRGGLALVVAAGLLLPLLPTWAQQVRERPARDLAQIDELKKLVDAMRVDLDRAKADLAVKQAMLEEQARKLERLQAIQREVHPEQPRPAPIKPASPAPRTSHPGLERRLAALERQLSQALAELQALRRELALRFPAPSYQAPLLIQPSQPKTPPPLGYVMPLQKTP